jgi:protein-disulfide isomerase
VKKIEIPSDSPMRGSKTAKVTIVEWSDFECPFCERGFALVKKVEQAYGGNVRLVFRHQPLPMHEHARPAAEASMAAHEQGKFWEYHDRLFANQKALDRNSLEKHAADVGLDLTKFKAALDSGRFRAKVESDAREGLAVGATGTPTFFINGRELVGAQPFEKFKDIIDDEIKKADKLLASGTKPEELYAKLLEQAPAARQPSSEHGGSEVTKIEVGVAPVKGPKNAPVTIVEFSDFQCPFCKNVVPTLEALEKQYGNKVKVAFKNQPLPFHANARPAAAASLAANAQGKFWEYHDKLFAHQEALDRASLEKYAAELGLDMSKFKAALDSKKFDAQITADATEATWAGAEGTPTFFINGRKLVGAQPLDAFKAIIDEELKKASELRKTAKK